MIPYINSLNFKQCNTLPVGSLYQMMVYTYRDGLETGILLDENGEVLLSLMNMVRIGVNDRYLYLLDAQTTYTGSEVTRSVVFDFKRSSYKVHDHKIQNPESVLRFGFLGPQKEPAVMVDGELILLT